VEYVSKEVAVSLHHIRRLGMADLMAAVSRRPDWG
jgi:hypothetical protein